ncbi:YecA family protein [Chloroflexota bacterium]
MAKDNNNKVVSVRLSDKAVKELENISENWDIPVSSVARSFILSCLYSLKLSTNNWIRRERQKTMVKVVPGVIDDLSGRETTKKDMSKIERLQADLENRYKGLPGMDKKGNEILKDDWEFAITHRNYPCPCGSGKKYRKCHGM